MDAFEHGIVLAGGGGGDAPVQVVHALGRQRARQRGEQGAAFGIGPTAEPIDLCLLCIHGLPMQLLGQQRLRHSALCRLQLLAQRVATGGGEGGVAGLLHRLAGRVDVGTGPAGMFLQIGRKLDQRGVLATGTVEAAQLGQPAIDRAHQRPAAIGRAAEAATVQVHEDRVGLIGAGLGVMLQLRRGGHALHCVGARLGQLQVVLQHPVGGFRFQRGVHLLLQGLPLAASGIACGNGLLRALLQRLFDVQQRLQLVGQHCRFAIAALQVGAGLLQQVPGHHRRRINGGLGLQAGQCVEVLADPAMQRFLFLDQFPALVATRGQLCLHLADIGFDIGNRVVQISHVSSLPITIR
ncbi:hypothetical protein E4417_11570 [Stenotrophomonas maltophilia]|nr:hypothetical protein E4417_11570 [Stenotrophomonas maltophilia]